MVATTAWRIKIPQLQLHLDGSHGCDVEEFMGRVFHLSSDEADVGFPDDVVEAAATTSSLEFLFSGFVRVTAAPPPAPTGSRENMYRSLVADVCRALPWRQRRHPQVYMCFRAGVVVDGRQAHPSSST